MEPPENFQKFRDDAFLAANTLNDNLVLEYFYLSQFFDPNSLNQRRRRGLQVSNEAEGIEYRLLYRNAAARGAIAAPPGSQWNYPNQFGVFVIQKFSRDARATETPLECYYVIGGTLFKAPFAGDLIRQRTVSSVRHLGVVLSELTRMASWSLVEGFSWGQPESGGLAETFDAGAHTQGDMQAGLMDLEDGEAVASPEAGLPEPQGSAEKPGADGAEKRGADGAPRRVDSLTRWVDVENLCAKRPCTEANRVIEDTFAALAAASLKFNEEVDSVRGQWQGQDTAWQQLQLARLEPGGQPQAAPTTDLPP